jgi:hypothetical protein
MSDTSVITTNQLSSQLKRKREVPKTKSIKIRKLDEKLNKNTLFVAPKNKKCIVFNVVLNPDKTLKHILVVTKTYYHLKIYAITTEKDYRVSNDINFNYSTRNLREWEIITCNNEMDVVGKFMNLILTSAIKNIITYNAKSAEYLNGYLNLWKII